MQKIRKFTNHQGSNGKLHKRFHLKQQHKNFILNRHFVNHQTQVKGISTKNHLVLNLSNNINSNNSGSSKQANGSINNIKSGSISTASLRNIQTKTDNKNLTKGDLIISSKPINSSKNNSTKLIATDTNSKQFQIPTSVIIIFVVLVLIGIICYIIWMIYDRYITKKQYNQTLQNFSEQPKLSMAQKANLKLCQFKPTLKTIVADVDISQSTIPQGQVTTLKFYNKICPNFSALYFNKVIKTDSYFQVEILNIFHQLQFGFVNKTIFQNVNNDKQANLTKVGVIINTYGQVQINGQNIINYDWQLDYGDVIGMAITKTQKAKRIWITKNGVLMNPPTSHQIQNWLNQQQLSKQFKATYLPQIGFDQQFKLDQQNKMRNEQKKMKNDVQLSKKQLSLPSSQSFQYYAVFCCLQLMDQKSQSKKLNSNNETLINVNVGGKIFRMRDNNLKSGLLAESYEKTFLCGFPCCG